MKKGKRALLMAALPIAFGLIGCSGPPPAAMAALTGLGATMLQSSLGGALPASPSSQPINNSLLASLMPGLGNPGTTGPGSPGSTPGGTPGAVSPGGQAPDGGLNVPLINQGNTAKPASYCGPTCVAMCMAFFGKPVGAGDVHAIATSGRPPMYVPGGTVMERVAPYLQANGFPNSQHVAGQSLSWIGQQTRAGFPVIVHVRGDYGPRSTAGHYVVVTGLTPDGNVIINDPAGGRRIVCDAGTFDRAWKNNSGDCTVVKP